MHIIHRYIEFDNHVKVKLTHGKMAEKIPSNIEALVISETVKTWMVAVCLYFIFKFIFTAYICYFYNNVKPNKGNLI